MRPAPGRTRRQTRAASPRRPPRARAASSLHHMRMSPSTLHPQHPALNPQHHIRISPSTLHLQPAASHTQVPKHTPGRLLSGTRRTEGTSPTARAASWIRRIATSSRRPMTTKSKNSTPVATEQATAIAKAPVPENHEPMSLSHHEPMALNHPPGHCVHMSLYYSPSTGISFLFQI
jgi:hypothetical protein